MAGAGVLEPNERGFGEIVANGGRGTPKLAGSTLRAKRWRGGLATLPPAVGAYPEVYLRIHETDASGPLKRRPFAGDWKSEALHASRTRRCVGLSDRRRGI